MTLEKARELLAAAEYKYCYLHMYSKCMNFMIIWH